MIEQHLEPGVLLRRAVGLSETARRRFLHVHAQDRSPTRHARAGVGAFGSRCDALLCTLGERIHPVCSRRVKVPHRSQPGDHADRIGGERARMWQQILLGGWVHHVHDVRASRHRTNREPPTNHLAHRCEVALDAILHLQTAIGGAKRDDLIEQQQRAVLMGPRSYRLQEIRLDRIEPHAMRHQVEQHASDVVCIGIQNGQRPFDVVERQNQHIAERRIRRAVRQRHAVGLIDVAPRLRTRRLTYFGVVIAAVVRPLHLGDSRPTCERAGRLDRHHDRLGA